MPADATSTFLPNQALLQLPVGRGANTAATPPTREATTTAAPAARVVIINPVLLQVMVMRDYASMFWPTSANQIRARGTTGLLYPAQGS